MIYSHPSLISPAVDEDTIAGLIDVAPTLLAAAGIDIPGAMVGSDVLSNSVDVTIAEVLPGDMVARTARFTAHPDLRGDPRRLAFIAVTRIFGPG